MNDESSSSEHHEQHRKTTRSGLVSLPLAAETWSSFDAILDVRSPAEFALDHVPGAQNFPVLSNEERILIGTRYKDNPFEAKKRGAALVARNIAIHIEAAFADKPRSWKPLIYCWRGGARSGAMTHILRSVGWNAQQLAGGYKAWRAAMLAEMETLPNAFAYIVICGRTGSGKSRLLEALATAGAQVLDLEKLAAHKGSVLGNLPDEPQPAQKMFESRVWAALKTFDPSRPVYVEAESKKVGECRVPESLITQMWQGQCIEVVTSEPLRVKLLREEYAHLIANPALLFSKLDCLKTLHPLAQIEKWKALANAGDWDTFVADMLVHHYDPAYTRSMFRNYVHANHAGKLVVKGVGKTAFNALARTLLE